LVCKPTYIVFRFRMTILHQEMVKGFVHDL
jgi:hypothetical protein